MTSLLKRPLGSDVRKVAPLDVRLDMTIIGTLARDFR
jgi:hypothetical protein